VAPEPACPFTISIGAFLVGALDPTDRQDLQVHLADCEQCRSELALLAQLPGLLHRHQISVEDRWSGSLGIMRGGAALPSDTGVEPDCDGGPERA
jgi:Putative zinc-finger